MITSECLNSTKEILAAWKIVTHRDLSRHRIVAATLLEDKRLYFTYHSSQAEIDGLMCRVVDNPIILRLFERRNRQITQK